MENRIHAIDAKRESGQKKVTRFIRDSFSAVVISLPVCCFLLFASFLISQSFAEEKKEPVPTVITSDSLTADNKAKTALFMGSVVAKKGDMTLFADRMTVYYVDSGSGGSNIDKIEAEGNVKLTRGDRVVTAGKAVYYAGPEERAVFTESPRAIEGKNVVTGTKMTYYMKDDRSAVENSRVFLVEKEQGVPSKTVDKGAKKK